LDLDLYYLFFVFYVFFFFSSRRRHTRWPRDWSSDVCSSDLTSSRGATPRCASKVRSSPTSRIPSSSSGRGSRTSPSSPTRRITRSSSLRAPSSCARSQRSEERRVGKEGRSGRWAGEQGESEM